MYLQGLVIDLSVLISGDGRMRRRRVKRSSKTSKGRSGEMDRMKRI